MNSYPISPPASYVTPTAVGFADSAGGFAVVSKTEPLPVVSSRQAAPAALAGETSQSVVAGPYLPLRDAPIHLELSGDWTGLVSLQRSTDGGATRHGLTAGGMPWATFAGNANEVVWQEGEIGVSLYLEIEVTSGTLGYRLSQ